jgi:imidazolonepropionase-like amidohydrolase
MKSRILILLAFLLAATAHAAEVLAIRNVTVIDATGAPAAPGMTVVFQDGAIRDIGKTPDISIPEGATVADGSGKFMIPGLWDMHIHLALVDHPGWTRKITLPLLTANGIAGVRDTGGNLEELRRIQSEMAAGTIPMLHFVTPGSMLDGPGEPFPGVVRVEDGASARKAVATLSEQKVDYIKVLSSLPREVFLAVADESRKRGLPLAGHQSQGITIAEISDAGQKCIEHLDGVLLGCSSGETEIRAAIDEALKREDFGAFAGIRVRMLDTYDEQKASALFRKFAGNGTWQAPTLTFLRVQASLHDAGDIASTNLKYVPKAMREKWLEAAAARKVSDADRELGKRRYRKNLELVAAMKKAGVGVLAGTDSDGDTAFLVPGFSLHDELSNLVEAGLTPMEALLSATSEAARFLGREKSRGTLQKGMAGDAVLLDANPLDNIANTRRIHAVILGGKLMPRKFLDGMLSAVEQAASPQ